MALKAFVASTFEDLKSHRAYTISALRSAGIWVDPMEEWTSANDEPKRFSVQRLQSCNLCILIVAFRRGHIPMGGDRSIVQLEYEAARENGLDVLTYLLDEDAPWPRRFDETSVDPEIVKWRAELFETRGVSKFGLEPASLQITSALARWLNERVHTVDGRDETRTVFDPEEELWRLVRDGEDLEEFQRFARDFPNGRFSKVAQARIDSLNRQLHQQISEFILGCREHGLNHGPKCEQCGVRVFIELPEHLRNLLEKIRLPEYTKRLLHANGGLECSRARAKGSGSAVPAPLTPSECQRFISGTWR